MQTFLPYPDFAASVAVLDTARLGKQRVETLQILRALTLPEYGWRNHPAVRMWRWRVDALVRYGLDSVAAWRERGYPDSTAGQIAEFAPDAVDLTQDDLAAQGRLPGWLGDERLHRSHRSKLLAKDPLHYGRYFTDVPADLDYFWPDVDDAAGAGAAVDLGVGGPGPGGPGPDGASERARLWVVQPDDAEALGRFLQGGVVALGTASGITADATGQDLTGLQQMLGAPTRRVTRPLIALARFIGDIGVGDEVAVLIDGGRRLLVGAVEGPYEFRAASGDSAPHRRRVRWERVVPRSAVTSMSALQDVRPVFDVQLSQDGPMAHGAGTAIPAQQVPAPAVTVGS